MLLFCLVVKKINETKVNNRKFESNIITTQPEGKNKIEKSAVKS